MNSKKKAKFRGKQVLVVGLIALVLAAGYYRWTISAVKSDAVSVSSTVAPDDAETFWSNNKDNENKDNENKDNNDEKQNNSDNNEQQNQENQNNQGQSANVITQSRQDRDKLRGDTMDKWKEISSNKDATESSKKEAESNIVKLTKYSENENAIETGVKSKGFEDCFVQVSDSGVSVVVKGGNLDSASVAQIKVIIIAETGVAASQIKISSEQ